MCEDVQKKWRSPASAPMGSGHYLWGVVIIYGEWSLFMGSGHYVWGVVTGHYLWRGGLVKRTEGKQRWLDFFSGLL